MKPFLRLAMTAAIASVSIASHGEAANNKYVLVAAMGDRYIATHEVQQIGSRLPPWRKRPLEVKDDAINKIVLASLDQAVVKMHPEAERTYVTVKLSNRVMDRPRSIEEGAFETAIDALRNMPERSKWYRIVLVTPTNRVQTKDKLAPDTQGMGILQQGLCQSEQRDCDRKQSSTGVEVETPNGEKVLMSHFVAPYYFAKVWIIDPESLTVMDTEVIHDHVKLNDPNSNDFDMSTIVSKHYLAERIVQQVETSTAEAVKRSELRGKVEVKDLGEAKPK
jgi:hypothetical protein